ncbi:MAG: hypothetical protein AB1553_13560 [Nitrospirota bacterium]
MRLQSLLRNINILNLLLLGSALAFAGYVLFPMFNVTVKLPVLKTKAVVEEKKEGAAGQPQQIPPHLEYTIIAEQNLFHPERKIPPLKKEEKALPKPEFVLYGTLITDEVSLAYMTDKKAERTTPGRGKRQNALKIGDSLSGYVLKEVKHEKVVLVRGEDRIEVKVITSGKKDRSGAVTTAAAPPQGEEEFAPQHSEQGGGRSVQTPPRPAPRPQTPPAPGSRKPGSTWRF